LVRSSPLPLTRHDTGRRAASLHVKPPEITRQAGARSRTQAMSRRTLEILGRAAAPTERGASTLDAAAHATRLWPSRLLVFVRGNDEQPGTGNRVDAQKHHRDRGDVEPCRRVAGKYDGADDQSLRARFVGTPRSDVATASQPAPLLLRRERHRGPRRATRRRRRRGSCSRRPENEMVSTRAACAGQPVVPLAAVAFLEFERPSNLPDVRAATGRRISAVRMTADSARERDKPLERRTDVDDAIGHGRRRDAKAADTEGAEGRARLR
jgi:hypothetical protein